MKWNEELIASELKKFIHGTGHMPSSGFLVKQGRNDLACAINKSGGLIHWAKKLDATRLSSDSDFGWLCEDCVQKQLENAGFSVERMKSRTAPFDILVNGILKIDVKGARFTEYGVCKGWFFRIGKIPQADIIALHQYDTGDTMYVPWHESTSTNITISKDNPKYGKWKNRFDILTASIKILTQLKNTQLMLSGNELAV